MSLFKAEIDGMRRTLTEYGFLGRKLPVAGKKWPRSEGRQMILEQDMAAELGHGRFPSISVILWTWSAHTVEDGAIRLYGPDIPAIAGSDINSVPFGKVVLLEVSGIPEGEVYPAFEQMDAVRFDMNLKGYMLRGTVQRNREWGRVGKKACRDGFCFSVLGSELLRGYKKLPFVRGAEILFFTDEGLIRELTPMAEKSVQITRALNTMFENIDMDCKHCDSATICETIPELKALHKGRMG
ncbi:MAG: hypothetical protein LBR77_07625 [Lachnospiraceae bacterium]|nr:hypothetical protein [Lachnospiraceae bacterium]